MPRVLQTVLALAACEAVVAQTVIDTFDKNQTVLTQSAAGTASSIVSGAILGGERDEKITVTSGSSINTEVKNGTYIFTQGAGAAGNAELVWDGMDGTGATIASTGLGSLNLTTGSQDAFLLGVLSASQDVSATLTIYSSGGTTKSFSFTIPAGTTPNYMLLRHSNFVGTGNLTSVGAIQLVINSSPGSSLVLDFLRTASVAASTPLLEATLTDVVFVDNDGNGKPGPGDTLRYIVRIKNNDSVAKTGVTFNAPVPANTTLGTVTATPLARTDGPASPTSVPGDIFHIGLNATLDTTGSGPKLLDNDFLGAPSATVTNFGGGSMGGAITDHNGGDTVSLGGGGTLKINADGSFIFQPNINFVGNFTFQYRLANASGSSDATVTIAVGVRPGAATDSYSVIGNTMIDTTIGLASLLANDSGDQNSVTANTSPSKGTVVRTGANFTYIPNAGATGSDSFTYTLHNGFGDVTGTVNLAIANEVWYIDNSVAVNGDGRSSSPFKTLANFNAVNTGASAGVPGDNDTVFIRQGSSTYQNDVGGGALTLRAGQKIIGDGWSGSFNAGFGFDLVPGSATAAGIPVPALTGIDPVIANTIGHGIALNSGNTLRGLTVGNTASGFGYSGGAVGVLTLADCSKIGTGGAISITASGTFGSTVNFNTLESTSSTGANLNLVGVTGTLAMISAGSGFGASASSAAAVNISGGSVSFTYPGNITKNNNAALLSVTSGHIGTLTFNTGTLNASSGTGLQFDNADGSYNFSGTTTLSGGDAGIDILNGSSGTFDFGTGTTITNPSGTAFNLNSSAANVTYSGSISDSTGFAIDIDNHDSGTVTFQTGSITSTAQGLRVQNCNGGTINFSNPSKTLNTSANAAVTLANNSGASINFTGGGLAIVTSSGTGFNATGGGTITVQGAANTISATNGIALNVAGTTIGTVGFGVPPETGLRFQSISSGGSAGNVGISLDTTGASGSLTVTGTGSAGSGGTIANKTGGDGRTTSGIGIYLNSTTSPSFTRMQLNGFSNFAIRGTTVAGFTLSDSIINGVNGDNPSVDDATVAFDNLTGSASILRCTIQGGIEDNFRVINTSGTLNRIVFDTTTIGANDTSSGDNGVLLQVLNSATLNATIKDCSFTSARGDMFQFDLENTSLGNLILMNTTFINSHSAIVTGGGGVTLSGGGSLGSNVSFTYDIEGCTFQKARGDALLVALQTGGGSFSGKINNCTFGLSGTDQSGSSEASTIEVRVVGGGASAVTISNNSISQFSNFGILLQAGDLAASSGGNTPGSIQATVVNNALSNPSTYSFNKDGIQLNLGTSSLDTHTACVDIRNNTASDTGTGLLPDIQLRQRQSTSARIPGYGGTAKDNTAIANFVQAQNLGSPTVTASTAGGGGFAGGAACSTP